MSKLILASGSPRRRKLMEQTGLAFTVIPAETDESTAEGLPPKTMVKHLARQKALAVVAKHPGAVVLGADTMVAVDGEVLGKPKNEEDARRMLRLLSGREHCVHTGVCVVTPSGTTITFCETSYVTFRGISPDEIDRYVATGEPMDKAGAYAIQGRGAKLVRDYSGDYTNIVGLPAWRVLRVLCGFGKDIPF